MIEESEVREKLARVLQDQESLEVFEGWLVENSWNMHRDSSADARRLVGEVELALAEYSSGHLDHVDLRDRFRSLLDSVAFSVVVTQSGVHPARGYVIASASNFVVADPLRWQKASPKSRFWYSGKAAVWPHWTGAGWCYRTEDGKYGLAPWLWLAKWKATRK